jgi:hypothetical protein
LDFTAKFDYKWGLKVEYRSGLSRFFIGKLIILEDRKPHTLFPQDWI